MGVKERGGVGITAAVPSAGALGKEQLAGSLQDLLSGGGFHELGSWVTAPTNLSGQGNALVRRSDGRTPSGSEQRFEVSRSRVVAGPAGETGVGSRNDHEFRGSALRVGCSAAIADGEAGAQGSLLSTRHREPSDHMRLTTPAE
jgi:hypothetical protein